MKDREITDLKKRVNNREIAETNTDNKQLATMTAPPISNPILQGSANTSGSSNVETNNYATVVISMKTVANKKTTKIMDTNKSVNVPQLKGSSTENPVISVLPHDTADNMNMSESE